MGTVERLRAGRERRLAADNERLRALVLAMAERMAAMSAALTRCAERKGGVRR